MASGDVVEFCVRYSETDQMRTFYNPRVREWFECGRTECLRHAGIAYAEMETRASKSLFARRKDG